MLFSEPKIPQSRIDAVQNSELESFSALQRAENSSITLLAALAALQRAFQCSSASRKFLNRTARFEFLPTRDVSVLFSEPKIPQSCSAEGEGEVRDGGFSALQRAENSSMLLVLLVLLVLLRFSALQRAENSSMEVSRWRTLEFLPFQCSSASRKFLNRTPDKMTAFYEAEFQCSSASRKFLNVEGARDAAGNRRRFSALQRAENSSIWNRDNAHPENNGFSALQRAENSSIVLERVAHSVRGVFQCSSASRKFLNPTPPSPRLAPRRFQCSSASRKFLNLLYACASRVCTKVSVLFSEPKIPQLGTTVIYL